MNERRGCRRAFLARWATAYRPNSPACRSRESACISTFIYLTMSSCFSQVYASFIQVDSTLTLDQVLKHLQHVIQSEVRNDAFDHDASYEPLAAAFSYFDAFDIIFEDDFNLAEYCQLTLESGSIVLQGSSVENGDDHVTRWVAWVLFREFGAGNSLCFSSETIWREGTSRCFYQVNRDGTVTVEVVYPQVEEYC